MTDFKSHLTGCPSSYEIEQALLGLSPDSDLEQIQEHILQCDACVRTAGTVRAHDQFVACMADRSPTTRMTSHDRYLVNEIIDRFIADRAESISSSIGSTIAHRTDGSDLEQASGRTRKESGGPTAPLQAPQPADVEQIRAQPAGAQTDRPIADERNFETVLSNPAADGGQAAVAPSGTQPSLPVPGLPQPSLPQSATPQPVPAQSGQPLSGSQLFSPAGRISTGSVLGNYTLLEKIGQGGMGQVFRAHHRRMERVVALKVLPAAFAEDPGVVERFQREVKAAARLSHPNIVTAFDADEAGGTHFLVMEYVQGQDLSALVRQFGPPVDCFKAVDWIVQAARGLAYAHSEHVAHRDIKPSNLILDRQGRIRILDLGLARVDLGASHGADVEDVTDLTSSGMVMGTADYMAPEQALDSRHADGRADIYSLGATLHYVLTGRPMYGGDTMMKRLYAHRDQPIPTLQSKRPDVPEDLDAVYQKMVAKDPRRRFQTMDEVIAALEKCVQDRAQPARQCSPPVRPVERSRRTL